MSDRLRIGYLHIGAPSNGIARYGRLLAREAIRRSPETLEAAVELTGTRRDDLERVAEAAHALAHADLVHIQYSLLERKSVWGEGWQRMTLVRTFAAKVRVPFVATVHDVARPQSRGLRHRLSTHTLAVRSIGAAARACIVCSQTERERLLRWLPRATVHVVPHLVEARNVARDPAVAKRRLGLSGRRVVTLLGFIHRRKGYHLLLDALAALPGDVVALLVGQPVDEAAAGELREFSARYGDRVRVTGFVGDADLDTYLAATDLAVCPFRDMSASGSLSTWIAARRPIVAADLPQIAEYNDRSPGAIATFAPYTPAALASRLCELLGTDNAARMSALDGLRESLRTASILDEHYDVYRRCAAGRPAVARNLAVMAGRLV